MNYFRFETLVSSILKLIVVVRKNCALALSGKVSTYEDKTKLAQYGSVSSIPAQMSKSFHERQSSESPPTTAQFYINTGTGTVHNINRYGAL